MSIFELPARRLIFAGSIAFAVAIGPTAAVVAGPNSDPLPRATAQQQCAAGLQWDANAGTCKPIEGGYSVPGGSAVTPENVAPGVGGAPSEQDLTESNPGVGSPTHH